MKKSGGEGGEEKEGKEHQGRAGGECGKVEARIYIGRSWRTATARTIQRTWTLFQILLKSYSYCKIKCICGQQEYLQLTCIAKCFVGVTYIAVEYMQSNVLK